MFMKISPKVSAYGSTKEFRICCKLVSVYFSKENYNFLVNSIFYRLLKEKEIGWYEPKEN